jgi:hypothetical protein
VHNPSHTDSRSFLSTFKILPDQSLRILPVQVQNPSCPGSGSFLYRFRIPPVQVQDPSCLGAGSFLDRFRILPVNVQDIPLMYKK